MLRSQDLLSLSSPFLSVVQFMNLLTSLLPVFIFSMGSPHFASKRRTSCFLGLSPDLVPNQMRAAEHLEPTNSTLNPDIC